MRLTISKRGVAVEGIVELFIGHVSCAGRSGLGLNCNGRNVGSGPKRMVVQSHLGIGDDGLLRACDGGPVAPHPLGSRYVQVRARPGAVTRTWERKST